MIRNPKYCSRICLRCSFVFFFQVATSAEVLSKFLLIGYRRWNQLMQRFMVLAFDDLDSIDPSMIHADGFSDSSILNRHFWKYREYYRCDWMSRDLYKVLYITQIRLKYGLPVASNACKMDTNGEPPGFESSPTGLPGHVGRHPPVG